MPQLNFQFHARREETSEYIAKIINEFQLTSVAIDFFPFKYQIYGWQEITTDVITNCTEFLLMQQEPNIGATERIEFLRANKGFLCIEMGKQENKTLIESQIGGEADGETLRLWRNIVSRYKRKLCKGAWIIGASGVKRYKSAHRYTPAVREMYEQGWAIRAIAGANIYEFRD